MIYQKYYLIFTILFYFFNNIFLSAEKAVGPELIRGIVDLKQWDFNRYGIVELKGESEFYWNQLLSPSDFSYQNVSKTGYIQIPGEWNGYVVDGKAIKGQGFATYRFFLALQSPARYGMKIREFDCAYKIWIDGILKDSVGIVSDSRKFMKPSWKRNEVYFDGNDSLVEVIIQISNFHHRKGGPEDVIILGLSKQIISIKHDQFGKDFFLAGVLLIMGMLHFFIFLFRQKEKAVLYFTLLCFAMLIRLITTNEKIIYEIFPAIDWTFAVRIEYLSYTLIVPFFIAFFHSVYPQEVSRKVVYAFSLIAAVFSLSYILMPVRIFSYTPIYYQVVVVLAGIYLTYCIILAIKRKRDNGWVFLVGFIFFFLVVINDILYYNKIISSTFLLPVGLFVMIFSQSLAISRKLFHAFNEVENLSNILDKYNRELENIVEERTEKIKAQNEEIISQSERLASVNKSLNELIDFKESMTNMVVHDMKNHLNHIILLTELNGNEKQDGQGFSKTLINQSARQILNLIMNILDIQRFEEAKMDLKFQQTTIYNIVNNAIKILEISALRKNILIHNQCSPLLMLKLDAVLMERVFINLISNAIRFSDVNGKIIIKDEMGENFIRYYVIDNGKGIDEKELPKVFDKYYKTDINAGSEIKPTGLGLTFCKLAVEAHNGQIGVESKPGKGSVFWFTLPYHEKLSSEILVIDSEIIGTLNELSEADRSYLSEFCRQLSNIKYYEVTYIKNILENINASYSPAVKHWIENINKAVFYGEKDAYYRLINMVLK